jgi:DNA-binding response OmpR family regulator
MTPVVLTVTNDPHFATVLQQLLSVVSLQMVLKDSLQLAAQYLRSESLPQLVILDWALHDGLIMHFLRQMRGQARFAELPVLVIVAEPDPTAIKEVLEAGANRYLTHTFVQANLLRALRDMQIAVPQVP